MKARPPYAPAPFRPLLLRYGMAVAIILWVFLFVSPVHGLAQQQPFVVMLGGVALSAWYGGMGPGLLAALAGAIAGFWFSPPQQAAAFGSGDFLEIGSYLIAALSIGALADRRDAADAYIRASRDEIKTVLSCVPDGVCAVATDGRLLYCNEEAKRSSSLMMALFCPEESTGYDVFDEAGQPYPTTGLLAQLIASGEDRGEAVIGVREHETGRKRWLHVRATAIRIPSDDRMAVCVVHDITRIKEGEAERVRLLQAEQEARHAAERSASRLERLNALASALSSAVTTEDVADAVVAEGIMTFNGPSGVLALLTEDGAALRIVRGVGLLADCPIVGMTTRLEEPSPLADAVRSQDLVWLESRNDLVARYPNLSPGSDLEGARVSAPLLLDGRCLGALHIALNQRRLCDEEDSAFLWALTKLCAQALDRARLYEVERFAREEAEHSAHAMDEFIAMLSHEIRNPLNSVVAATTLLQHLRGGDPDLQEALEVLDLETQQITRLVNDLLDISRITRSKIELRKESLDLRQVVERAVRCLLPALEEQDQILCRDVSTEVLPVLIDPARMQQVIGNLLQNASKYSPACAPIHLSVRREGAEAVVRVRDEGDGIAPEFLPHVFDLFSQADHSLDRASGGLGIGLTLVQRLMQMHGGSVEAWSAGLGRGSEFTLRLPLLADAPQHEGASPLPATRRTNRQRILVVDDNRSSANLLVRLLRGEGHEVQFAADGEEALEAALVFKPHVVFLDIGLPNIDGFEVARRLRSAPSLTHTRLIALTGFGQPDDVRHTRAAGFEAHLTKPVDFDALLGLLATPAPSTDGPGPGCPHREG